MVDEYTPTTEEIRQAWWMSAWNPAGNEGESDLSFARWLAARDAEVRRAAAAEALDEWAWTEDFHRYVPDRPGLEHLCRDDWCLWWDMTRSAQERLRSRAAELRGE